ncbi:MAG: hypothetical protein QOD39_786 [Mycobacterium sp.]|jgi:hypothetical protein|nr:hypothetical protein [Mycobacterium sp.]
MYARTGQPSRAMFSHGFGGGLLQRFVCEQPVIGVGELRRRLAAQHGRLHQHGGALTETVARRTDIGDKRGPGQWIVGDLTKRLRSGLTVQIGDVVYAEGYDGLTPVTITL